MQPRLGWGLRVRIPDELPCAATLRITFAHEALVHRPGQCSTWNSEKGHVALWVNGDLVAATVDMATGHVIPEGGILQVGQEKNGCCVGGGFDETLAFSGRLTGFNIWDRVLSNEDIRKNGGAESCHIRGNVVGWAVTEIQPHGGAQYVS